jgi:hypothetical protein
MCAGALRTLIAVSNPFFFATANGFNAFRATPPTTRQWAASVLPLKLAYTVAAVPRRFTAIDGG